MSTTREQYSANVTSRILGQLLQEGVLNSTLVVHQDPIIGGLSITSAAVAVLRGAVDFFNWKEGQPRDAVDLWDEVNLGKDFPEELAREEILAMAYNALKDSIVAESLRQADKHNVVVGVDLMMAAMFHTLHQPGDDVSLAINFHSFIKSLNIQIRDTASANVCHSLNLKSDGGIDVRAYWDLLEGMMVALTLYPTIPYQLTINGAVMIPRFDSNVMLSKNVQGVVNQCYIVVLEANFTDHYVNDRPQHSGIATEPGYGYMGFDSQNFITGLLYLTSTIGVQQPWISMGTTYGPQAP